MINDADTSVNAVVANLLDIDAVAGMGVDDPMNVDITTLDAQNTGTGDITFLFPGDIVVQNAITDKGEITLEAANDLILANGAVISTLSSGDINFISDEWAQFEINFEALDDSVNHPNSPYGQVIDIEGDLAPES